MALVPTNRPPVHPGEVLVEEFLKPLRITQVDLADRLGVTFQTVNAIARGRRNVTPETALRLAKVFGTTAGFWLNLQQVWELYVTMHSAKAKQIEKLKPIAAAAKR